MVTLSATTIIHTPQPSVNVTLALPQIGNLKLLASLSALVKMSEILNVPLGDPAGGHADGPLQRAGLDQPATLSLKISATLKVAAVANLGLPIPPVDIPETALSTR